MNNKIIFKTLKFKNIQTYGNYWTEVNFTESPSVLITGKNGAGKSTLLNALTFNLYGKPYTKVKKEEIVNRTNAKGLLTELTFSIGSKEYRVVRGIKPNKFEIYEDDVLINQSSTVREYQIMLEQTILKMTELAFRQIVILGSADYVPFMKMGKSDKRKIGEELFNIQLFSVMNKLAKERLSKARSDLTQIENKQTIVENRLESIKESNAKIQENTDQLIDELKEENSTYKKEALTLTEDRKKLAAELLDIKELNSTKSDLDTKKTKLSSYIATFTSKITSFESNIEFYRDNEVCPTCTQSIQDNIREQKIADESAEIKKNREAIQLGLDKIKNIDTQLEDVISKISKHTKTLSEISSIDSTLRNLKQNIINNNTKIDNISNKITDDFTDSSKEEKELKTIKKEHKDKKNEIDNLENSILLLKDDGVKSKIISSYLPVFNSLLAKNLKLLDYNIHFSIDSQFNDVIKVGRETVPYLSNSEGQKKRLDLAMLFTMREFASVKNGSMTNLLILDEVMDSSLDEEGLYAFRMIMNEVIQDNTTVMVISHREGLSESFHSHIKVKLKNKFSKME